MVLAGGLIKLPTAPEDSLAGLTALIRNPLKFSAGTSVVENNLRLISSPGPAVSYKQ